MCRNIIFEKERIPFLSIYTMNIRNLKRISLEVLLFLFFITRSDCFSRHACQKLNPATNTLAGSWTRSVSIRPSNSQYVYRSGFANNREHTTRILSTKNSDVDLDDPFYDPMNIPKFVGGQSILILIAIAAASIFSVPNFGLGEGFVLNKQSILDGVIATLPLGLFAYVLDKIEPNVKALQDVSEATKRSVLAILGGKFKPFIALGASVALGAAAGVGEEMLFRGVLQTKLSEAFGDYVALFASSVVFGLGHAVTPFYTILAFLASLFFGGLYMSSHNLAVPMVCHGLYDVGALMLAHYNVTQLDQKSQEELLGGL